uniref:Zinc finger CCCH domain-containing protein 14 n=1 Tax=Strix occidentalis caurina TaxID=311401 RepID=A0A8D0FEJ4_STROC
MFKEVHYVFYDLLYFKTIFLFLLDEELPDYIMVMVANKKSQEQMTEDLSLFLGNNTVRFTVWYVCKLLITLLTSNQHCFL